MTAATALLAGSDLWQRFWSVPEFPLALLTGLGVALTCSVLSVFVVLRRMAFIGEGVAHAAFGGFAVAALAQLAVPAAGSPLGRDAIVAAFCVLTALVIGALVRRGRLAEDTSIGIVLVASMAGGVLLMNVRTIWTAGYTPPLHQVLFGDILLVYPHDVWIVWTLAAGVSLGVAGWFKELVFFTFDEEAARAFGVRTGLLHYGLLVALGLAVAAAMRTVGVILAGALLVLPGASARLWSARVGRVTILSAALGMIALAGGFFLSLAPRRVELATGPVIVLTLIAVFAASWLARTVRLALRRRRRLNHPAP